jgi:hypothetical protein
VDVTLADGLDAGAAALKSTVWKDPDGAVSWVLVRFASEEQQAERVLLTRMAEALGWIAEEVSDEVE